MAAKKLRASGGVGIDVGAYQAIIQNKKGDLATARQRGRLLRRSLSE